MHGNCHPPPGPIPFIPGLADLRVELSSGSRLTVRVASALTAGSGALLSKTLEFDLEGVAGAATRMTHKELSVERYGNVDEHGLTALHWNGLRAGAYRLRVLARGTDTVLAAIPSIEVNGSAVTAPSVLDLNRALYRFRLSIVGADGAPLRNAKTSLQWAPGVERGGLKLRGASWGGMVPQVPIELTCRAKGYLSVRRTLGEGDQRIVMQPVNAAVTRIQITGLDLPAGVQASLAWGPGNLPRDVREQSCFGMHENTVTAMDELRIGAQVLGPDLSVAIPQSVRPGPIGGLRLILVLSAPPLPGEPDLPTRWLLDDMPGWVLPNPQVPSAILPVNHKSLRVALAAMGRP